MYVFEIQKNADHHTGVGPLKEEPFQFAFVTRIEIRFNYQILVHVRGEDVIVRLEGIDKNDRRAIKWDPDLYEDAVKEFHGMVTMQEEDIVVALVRLSEQVPGQPRFLDIDGMKNYFMRNWW